MSEPAISFKGIRDGLLVTVGEGPWEEVEQALLKAIQQQQAFFRGAQLALQVGDRTLDRDEIRKLRDKLAEHDVRLSTLLGTSADTIRAARRSDLETELPEPVSDRELEDGELPPIDSDEHGIPGVLVKNTLRSGRVIRHTGHVVVIGDVNPGAQIIAGGDVLVWGRLRGTVHAGAAGDTGAVVCALDMRPQQLRIANHVAIGSTDNKPRPSPEIAFVVDGQIVAKEWGS
ncbi:MAG: septum site-determining protein MinC [Anaerolineae bacterium]